MADRLVVARRDWADALARQDEWERVRRSAPTEAVFSTPDWLETWWRHLGGSGDAAILTVERGGRWLGIAPLVRKALWPGGPRVLALMGSGVSDYADLLLPPDEVSRQDCLSRLIDALSRRPRGWDALDFAAVPAESPTARDVEQLARARRLPFTVETGYARPGIALRGSWPEYLKSRPGKFRYNLRSRLRRLEALGAVHVRWLAGPDEVGPAIEALAALHARRWAGQRTSTIFSRSSRGRAFYAEACRRYARRGLLDLALMDLDGRPIAGCLSFVDRETLYYYMPAWEPDLSRFAPSTLLLARLVERAYERGLARFDFMIGEEEYKLAWATEHRQTVRVIVGNAGPRGAAVVRLLGSLHRLRQRARSNAALRSLRRHGLAALVGRGPRPSAAR